MINIAKILRYCPEGKKLVSPVCSGYVEFLKVEDYDNDVECRIVCRAVESQKIIKFDKYGHLVSQYGVSEVPMLFPKKNHFCWDSEGIKLISGSDDWLMTDSGKSVHICEAKSLIVIGFAEEKQQQTEEVVTWQPKILGKILYRERIVNSKLGIDVKMWKAGLIEFIWKNCHVDNEVYTKVSLIGDTRVFRIDEDVIPLKGNEHLAHTTQKPGKKYKAIIK